MTLGKTFTIISIHLIVFVAAVIFYGWPMLFMFLAVDIANSWHLSEVLKQRILVVAAREICDNCDCNTDDDHTSMSQSL